MMRLTLLRHAKSSWDERTLDDHNRPLNERGWKAARRMGRELENRGLRFDYVLASTAARVRETIDGVQQKYDFAAPIRFEPQVYLADAATLLELVRALPADVKSALIVGHNPGLQRLAVELSHDDRQGLRRRVSEKFPTAALAAIELPASSWPEVQPGSGEILELILPRELGD
jgi:phosphohistidine phosphatase